MVIALFLLIIFSEKKYIFNPAGFFEGENLARAQQKCVTVV